VLEQLLLLYPTADLFAVCDFIPEHERDFLQGHRAQVTFIQKLPGANKHYRNYLPLMPLAIEQLDLSAYNIVISSSHAVAKGVLTGPNQVHVSYVHSPIRYAWDLQHQYLQESGLASGLKGCSEKPTSQRVTCLTEFRPMSFRAIRPSLGWNSYPVCPIWGRLRATDPVSVALTPVLRSVCDGPSTSWTTQTAS
jgi:hypothetical protein